MRVKLVASVLMLSLILPLASIGVNGVADCNISPENACFLLSKNTYTCSTPKDLLLSLMCRVPITLRSNQVIVDKTIYN
ncbi:hypothetical protein FIV31_05025 [Coxiella endosymbiont of Ornithodoros amblus]|uniref:hypothetical protein n=1 Tax=Coxiella endosymbiont of Ornithodoros amblus TaxID=1656166 RepID=UPI00244E404A|nr:hypothetical protein [Coxiella endosymbiont of Ornithodoros amblus]MBW5802818.1 hypothetical protein [Coxiella endosymbiont of Ornithodoros amblus]